MATSEVSLVNRALQKLGESGIEALDEDSPNARSMNTAYAPLRDKLQRIYTWNFCKARASIAAQTEQTAYGTLNRYQKPNDFLRLMRNKESSEQDVRHDWTIEGDYIVTEDSSPLQFRYIAKVTDTALFDPSFDEALATLIAKETCLDVTGSNKRKNDLVMDFKEEIASARQVNALENDSQIPLEDDWLLARY